MHEATGRQGDGAAIGEGERSALARVDASGCLLTIPTDLSTKTGQYTLALSVTSQTGLTSDTLTLIFKVVVPFVRDLRIRYRTQALYERYNELTLRFVK